MRAIAWEAPFQIALRNCSEEVGRRSVILVNGKVHAVEHTFLQKVAASHGKVTTNHVKILLVARSRHYPEGF